MQRVQLTGGFSQDNVSCLSAATASSILTR